MKIDRVNNTISFAALNDPMDLEEFKNQMHVWGKSQDQLILDWDGSLKAHAFPNVVVPLTVYKDFYAHAGVKFLWNTNTKKYFLHSRTFSAKRIANITTATSDFLGKVFTFSTNEEITVYIDTILKQIRQKQVCEDGTLRGLMWCLSEVLDNILVHSSEDPSSVRGYVMTEYLEKSHKIILCIADMGMGIFNSLKDYDPAIRNSMDAIEHAIREGVTDGKGAGNGLYGLYRIIENNSGSFTITSADAQLRFRDGKLSHHTVFSVSSATPGTIVDFQLNLDRKTALDTIWKDYELDQEDIYMDIYDDDFNCIYSVKEKTRGLSTRQTGAMTRNELINIVHAGAETVYISFADIQMVSSSFIDEFIGKLYEMLGEQAFTERIRLTNMDPIVRTLCNKAITDRRNRT